MKLQHTLIYMLSPLVLMSTSILALAAPGNLSQSPLYVESPIQPNIFFMLDDSSSMDWALPFDGTASNDSPITIEGYVIAGPPTIYSTVQWQVWCSGANLLGYNPNLTYLPWAANIPNTNTPFPNMTDITKVWADPLTQGIGSIIFTSNNSEHTVVFNTDTGSVDLSAAPVVQWTDSNNNGTFDTGECPLDFNDPRARRADTVSAKEKTNFANWFSYYRMKEHTLKSALTQVISTSSARMGMATLHHNRDVGVEIQDMRITHNKTKLLNNVVNINSFGLTPLRAGLNNVGKYFSKKVKQAPVDLNIGLASSPILPEEEGGACQQNFAILMTDGFWNDLPAQVEHQDNVIDSKYVYPAHQDNASDTLADVAMKWYRTDLAPSYPSLVPVQSDSDDDTKNLDENDDQHMVTFAVSLGAKGTLNNNPTDRNKTFKWPKKVEAGTPTTIDDLRHAAYNGRGQFLLASKPEELVKSMQDIVSSIESRQGSGSAIVASGNELKTGSVAFAATFNSEENWSGDVKAFQLDPSTGELAPEEGWSAADLLNARSNEDILANRVIYTWGENSQGDNDGVLFDWSTSNPQASELMLNDLKINPDSSSDTYPFTKSQERTAFLRGDTTKDGKSLTRKRSSRLGDIIGSKPTYIAEPISSWPDNTAFYGSSSQLYSDYQAGLQSNPRSPVVYVGANDGFLHGFLAKTGEEVLAYAPSAVSSDLNQSGLHYLTEFDYSHKYYVDGDLSFADVYIKSNAISSKSWRTALVGSLKGGGRGLFALDVTDPSNYKNNNAAAHDTVLWEFTDQDDPDLGYTFSRPQITMMNNGKWAVIIGNGYNATGSTTAQLMIIFIEDGVDGVWSVGDYIKIDTKAGDPSAINGLSSPEIVDLDNNGTTDRIYAGDLLGNLWAFDVSKTSASAWKIAHSGSKPLFAAGNSKPITTKPLVIKPESSWLPDTSSNEPNLMVYFGTGQYLALGDATSEDQQSFYGIWDTGKPVSASSLVEQADIDTGDENTRLLSQNKVTYDIDTPKNGNQGWVINFFPRERLHVNPSIAPLAGVLLFNPMTPDTADPCSAGGSSFLMYIDPKTGGTINRPLFDLDGNGIINADDGQIAGVKFELGIASETIVIKGHNNESHLYTQSTRGKSDHSRLPGAGAEPVPATTGARQSWIQLIND
mgnify:CR=1 FL=1